MRQMALIVTNPATEETIAELDPAGIDETDAAVARAKAAYKEWRAVAPTDRARLLRRLATLVEEHAEELARIESQNVGKPIAGARAEVGMVAQVFHFYAGAVDKHYGETIPVAGGIDITFREPLGVVGLIVPWNFPLNISSWKLGPALACGNTVVLKPAELTPLSALRLEELILEAGIPEGVVNVVVTNLDSQTGTCTGCFTYLAPAPAVTGVAPNPRSRAPSPSSSRPMERSRRSTLPAARSSGR